MLHITAWNGYDDLCRALLMAQASVNILGTGGSSALSLACQRGHSEIAHLLFSAECNVNQTSHLGESRNATPLHLAAQKRTCGNCQSGAVVNATMTVNGIQSVTPLHIAAQCEHLDIMDILIQAERSQFHIMVYSLHVHSST